MLRVAFERLLLLFIVFLLVFLSFARAVYFCPTPGTDRVSLIVTAIYNPFAAPGQLALSRFRVLLYGLKKRLFDVFTNLLQIPNVSPDPAP